MAGPSFLPGDSPGDPRIDPATRTRVQTGGGGGILPVVAPPPRGAPTALIVAGMVGAGLALFLLLNGHRTATQVPAVRAGAADRAVAAGAGDPPPLYVPPAPAPTPPVAANAAPAPPFVLPQPPRAPQVVYVPQPSAPAIQSSPFVATTPVQPARGEATPTLVIDTTVSDGNPGTSTPATPQNGEDAAFAGLRAANSNFASASTAAPGARARATMLGGRGTTVLQGTLIAVVLETALDTTRPGLARALVQQDVRSFDGSRVLIPRGSRLTGEYRSDVAPGQNRALIVWTRLVRPDGAAIAIASPSADTLGRAGVKAKVNSHFFARFAGAILQSVLSVGVNLASRPNNDTLVLGLPGSQFGGGGGLGFNQSSQVTPTLKVRAGTSISVFVSRDLDFADVEGRR